MDPNANINALQKYLDFYRTAMPPTDQSSNWNMGFGGGAAPGEYQGRALQWAMQQMNNANSNSVPDYFGGGQGGQAGGGYQPSAYVPPQQSHRQFQMPQAQQQPLTGQVNNYLGQLIGRR